ncbi:IPT/TIG domain-containing protein [Candidatus Nitrospira allomarina]|jgi:IPT/TIG domain-containing protein|uniref:IPT/TIG domain-containing protein n=1 Tax=Candidatus Nitrospira allomarina TaxID=3020900 RepID=A0AA96G8Y9_9BACT|nr:IPT/TIG domain-containing protein [Candidatus Nitrospira allomarina]WNM56987.1 IPT/TIG domain-containing protein [Candidatus Nitrospira allomarina]
MKRVRSLMSVALGFFLFSSVAYAEMFPSDGPPGTTVTISGEGFGEFQNTQANRVEFQGVSALIQSWEPDFILVKVPLHARSGPVMVINGSAKREAGIFSVTNVRIASLNPSKAEAGSLLTIVGEHFGNTAGSRDPNTMFGVNQVIINGIRAEVRRWRPTKIEVLIPANAKSGDVEVRLASSDPLPDGSCCAPVEYAVSNAVPLTIIPSIAFDPTEGPIGSKVILSGQGFGESRPEDGRIYFGGKPAIIAQWSDRTIVAHVPLNAQSGSLMLHREGKEREIGTFTILTSQISGMIPPQGPIGTLVTIKGKNFGVYSEAGGTAYAFDFLSGGNGVEIGGVPAVIHRWLDEQIDVWVPFSAKSGPVIVKRGGATPKIDGTCCERQEIVTLKAGDFTVVQPEIHSYSPKEAGLDEVVTITGKGFGEFLKISEATRLSLNQDAHDWHNYRLGQDVSRSEVLVNGIATHVESWTDTEIRIRVPRRPAFGFGNPEGFEPDLTKGELILKRGSWDMLDTGECCTPKKYITIVGGPFTILQRGLPDKDYWNEKGRAQ